MRRLSSLLLAGAVLFLAGHAMGYRHGHVDGFVMAVDAASEVNRAH